jgi:hypothetical protein
VDGQVGRLSSSAHGRAGCGRCARGSSRSA